VWSQLDKYGPREYEYLFILAQLRVWYPNVVKIFEFQQLRVPPHLFVQKVDLKLGGGALVANSLVALTSNERVCRYRCL